MAKGIDYIEVSIVTGSNPELKDILLAKLSDVGFEGFEEERNLLKAFIPESGFDEKQLKPIVVGYGLEYSLDVIRYKNWNELWEAGFEPVVVNSFCVIRAFFHQPVGGVRYDIIITPKMSFGTGHHATTYLMIEMMQHISINGKSVFDFGTGTGVLAILAEKMGASSIEAIDTDEWSIENGNENLFQNQSEKIILYKSDKINASKKFDIILANINRNVIMEHLCAMQVQLYPNGLLILSGLLTDDEAAVVAKARDCNLMLLSRRERNSWICLQFVNVQDY